MHSFEATALGHAVLMLLTYLVIRLGECSATPDKHAWEIKSRAKFKLNLSFLRPFLVGSVIAKLSYI